MVNRTTDRSSLIEYDYSIENKGLICKGKFPLWSIDIFMIFTRLKWLQRLFMGFWYCCWTRNSTSYFTFKRMEIRKFTPIISQARLIVFIFKGARFVTAILLEYAGIIKKRKLMTFFYFLPRRGTCSPQEFELKVCGFVRY